MPQDGLTTPPEEPAAKTQNPPVKAAANRRSSGAGKGGAPGKGRVGKRTRQVPLEVNTSEEEDAPEELPVKQLATRAALAGRRPQRGLAVVQSAGLKEREEQDRLLAVAQHPPAKKVAVLLAPKGTPLLPRKTLPLSSGAVPELPPPPPSVVQLASSSEIQPTGGVHMQQMMQQPQPMLKTMWQPMQRMMRQPMEQWQPMPQMMQQSQPLQQMMQQPMEQWPMSQMSMQQPQQMVQQPMDQWPVMHPTMQQQLRQNQFENLQELARMERNAEAERQRVRANEEADRQATRYWRDNNMFRGPSYYG